MCFQEITQHATDLSTSLDLTVNIIGGGSTWLIYGSGTFTLKNHNNMVDQKISQIVAKTSHYIHGFKKTLKL